jgi:hypothetical protein
MTPRRSISLGNLCPELRVPLCPRGQMIAMSVAERAELTEKTGAVSPLRAISAPPRLRVGLELWSVRGAASLLVIIAPPSPVGPAVFPMHQLQQAEQQEEIDEYRQGFRSHSVFSYRRTFGVLEPAGLSVRVVKLWGPVKQAFRPPVRGSVVSRSATSASMRLSRASKLRRLPSERAIARSRNSAAARK